MPTIYEIFGHTLQDQSPEAQQHRQQAECPFMNKACDGGGNRSQTKINLLNPQHKELLEHYPNRTTLIPGVCSIIVANQPWVICPRRLMVLGSQSQHQKKLRQKILGLLDYPPDKILGVWSEIKVKYGEIREDSRLSFDYTFDYILFPVGDMPIIDLLKNYFDTPQPSTKKLITFSEKLIRAGYIIEDGIIKNFPLGAPTIIEIMTSSTSGSNEKKGTQIAQAFENAILGKPHQSPGINYRQVWSRMVGQLFVKSEVALHWGGKTIWVLQDVLAKYITASTRLNLDRFRRDKLEDVNLLTFDYENYTKLETNTILELSKEALYAGELEQGSSKNMMDIVRLSIQPPLSLLIKTLVQRGAAQSYLIAP